MQDKLVDRFLKYIKFETRSDEKSLTVPSTKTRWILPKLF